jgi:hypothetical protein
MARHFNFDQIRTRFPELNRKLLIGLGKQAQNYFFKSFKDQGFDGQEWDNVKRRIQGEKAYEYPKTKGLQRRTSPILVGAGYEKRGVTLAKAVSTMSQTASFSGNTQIKMQVNVPYSGYLNEGTDKMTKRQFVGQTDRLTDMQRKRIIKTVDEVFGIKA